MTSQVEYAVQFHVRLSVLVFMPVLTCIHNSFQIVSGGAVYSAEYVVVEANCTEDPCVPLTDTMAVSGKKDQFNLAQERCVCKENKSSW